MAPQFAVASRSRARTKKEDPRRRKGGSGAEIGGSRARHRASSVSGALGAGNDGHEVIVITDNEDGSDDAMPVSGTFEEEEEPRDYRLQTARRFEPNQISLKVRSFGEQGEGNGGSFGSEDDHYAQNLSRKNTPSVTEDPEADLSSGYLTSSTESSTEADDSSDEDYVAHMSESLSTDGETSLSSEEYTEREKNMKRRKKGKREDKGESSCLYSARKTNKKVAIDCEDDPMIDNVGRKENAEHRVSWVNEWLLDDAEEKKVEQTINVDRLNAEIDCPYNDDNGKSGQMEEGGSSRVSERGGGSREMEETGRRGEDDDERWQEEGKAATELDGANAETDVSFSNEKGKTGETEERGNFRAPEEERLKQSQEKSTSQSKVSGVDRRMEEKRYRKHVQSGSTPVIQNSTSSKVEGQKERDSGMSCGSQQLQKKRKHEDCSGEKPTANGVTENDCRANWKSRTRRERAREPWLNKFFKLADCLWGKDDLQQDKEKENADKEEQSAGDSTAKAERRESMKCGILTKPSEEGVGANQAEARKDSWSTPEITESAGRDPANRKNSNISNVLLRSSGAIRMMQVQRKLRRR